jgi:hypothetical protein
MKGYLNNLTQRTLNTGNRVEPRLPSMFESRAFDSGPPVLESEVSMVSEAPPRQAMREQPRSEKELPRRQATAKVEGESEERDVAQETPRLEINEVVESAPLPSNPTPDADNGEVDVDPVKALPLTVNVQALEELVEDPTESLGVDESSSPFLESAASAPLWPKSSAESHTKAAPRRRTPRRGQISDAPATPARSPATEQFQAQISVRKNGDNQGIKQAEPSFEIELNEENSEVEQRVTEELQPEQQFDSINFARHARVNRTSTTWRDTRQQQSPWRRRQSFEPIEAEPSINVTIGRVEVRALPSDTRKTTAPRQSESPVMPLEEYLRKQRRGGER